MIELYGLIMMVFGALAYAWIKSNPSSARASSPTKTHCFGQVSGTRLPRMCLKCSAWISEGARFCSECGFELPQIGDSRRTLDLLCEGMRAHPDALSAPEESTSLSSYIAWIAELGHYQLAEVAYYDWVESTFGVRVYPQVRRKISTVRELAQYIDSQLPRCP